MLFDLFLQLQSARLRETVKHKTKQFDAPSARFADTPADDDSGEAGDE